MQGMKQTEQMKKRDSNLELYRVIVMLLIVAHHYVVNSGISPIAYENLTGAKSLFLFIFGAFGKTGINCFLLITGFYMCTSSITLKKYAKLILEVMFYRALFYILFWVTGVSEFSITGFIKTVLPVTSIKTNFTGCFLVFYLCIPFLSILVKNLTERQHRRLIFLCLGVCTVLGTIPWFELSINYTTWFCILFFVASYIRLHPCALFRNKKLWGWSTLLCLAAAVVSVVFGAHRGHQHWVFYLVSDSYKLLAVALSISSFLFFKNLKLKYNPLINAMGASTFGVLLIHANGDTMRAWLWQTLLKTPQMYDSPWLAVHAFASVVCVFLICVVIDQLRIRLLEVPFFKLWDKYYPSACSWVSKHGGKLLQQL